MEQFAQLIALAALVGLLTDRFKKTITDKQSLGASITIGVLLACVYQQGLLQAAGMVAKVPFGQYLDYILSGVLIAAGPNVVYDFIKARTPQLEQIKLDQ